jgi:hypothetical protein
MKLLHLHPHPTIKDHISLRLLQDENLFFFRQHPHVKFLLWKKPFPPRMALIPMSPKKAVL